MISVVFDMDGILFDTQKIYMITWKEIGEMLGFENFDVPANKCIGTNRTDQNLILSEYKKDFPFEEFYKLKDELFNKHLEEGIPLMKGTREILEYLKSVGAKVAVASSSRVDMVKHHLDETGLTDYFDVIVGGDMVEHSKPSPDIYLKACEKLGVEPSQTYAVEDSYNGIRSAAAAGMKVIMIPDVQPPTPEYDAMISARFESLLEFRNNLILKQLMERLWAKYEYASVLFAGQHGKRYSVSGQGVKAVEDKLFCSRGYVLKVYNGKRYAEYSFNELDTSAIDGICDKIDDLFASDKYLSDGMGVNEYAKIEDEAVKSFTENKVNLHPEKLGDEAILEKLTAIRKEGMSVNDRILDCAVNSAYQEYSKYFLSNNREMSEKVLWMTGSLSMMAKKGEVVKRYFKGYSNLDGAAVLDEIMKDVPNVAACAEELLDAEKITPGEYDCICTPEVTGMIVHEAFGHGVEMDMFVKDRALAKNYIGEYVASPLVTMHDGAAAAKEVATYDFDDEGMSAKDTVVIEKGILKSGISDAQTALSLKTKSTGNGRRENFERKAYTRMTNTFFEGGNDKVEDMIASIEYGFMLENATCGMEDPKNWGIQCMVNVAREIKDGKFTGKIFSPIVLSGYVPDLLKSISMMSGEVKLGGGGFCGKGHKEWVKVSDGGPYIKARIKLG